MGDILMTEPALRALKEAVPERQVTLLTSRAGSLITPFIPAIDDVIVFDVPWVRTSDAKGPKELFGLVEELKNRKFDAAVIFTTYSQSALPTAILCYMAGTKTVLAHCHEQPHDLISDWVPDYEPVQRVRHEVERQLDLVKTTGATTDNAKMSLDVPQDTINSVTGTLKDLGIKSGDKWLVLHPGVSEEKRRYPADKYIEAAHELMGEGYKIILTGSSGERDYAETIRSVLGNGAFNLAGELSIAELIALISRAPLLVSNNTGPVHIASAVGTPVVVLYAMTNPQHTPWQVPNRVLYFAVPEHLKSKNFFLQTFPGPTTPKALPQAIVQAVHDLTGQKA
jgi:ADP-heptose:LPS heptosyltransferase